jgi:hypothetical protein
MAKRKGIIDRAIEAVDQEIAALQMARAKLVEQLSEKPKRSRPRAVKTEDVQKSA